MVRRTREDDDTQYPQDSLSAIEEPSIPCEDEGIATAKEFIKT